ncbi:hypothetical protein NQ117_23055 [Paenibacillus sp. SC116]|uniref:hypothetical protein n=1 Tax=Paenibacillus sp. SC116 TaxID=2968986 RepID=UPI00215A8262|nr:hypothetical protein [Paenibacillus sp. SC116]MCR8846569.1 hypothetical protein [Paenibacillus sp. SC116]
MKVKFNTKVIKPRGSAKTLKTARSANTAVNIPDNAKKQKVTVAPNDAKTTQDLGQGFYRFTFFYDLDPGSFFTFYFRGREYNNYKPISGGWWAVNNLADLVICNSNYAVDDYDWITVLYNPTDYTRQAAFVITAKQ